MDFYNRAYLFKQFRPIFTPRSVTEGFTKGAKEFKSLGRISQDATGSKQHFFSILVTEIQNTECQPRTGVTDTLVMV